MRYGCIYIVTNDNTGMEIWDMATLEEAIPRGLICMEGTDLSCISWAATYESVQMDGFLDLENVIDWSRVIQ